MNHFFKCKIFEGLNKEEIQELTQECVELDIERGQTIVRQNNIEDYIFIIVDGSVSCFRKMKKES